VGAAGPPRSSGSGRGSERWRAPCGARGRSFDSLRSLRMTMTRRTPDPFSPPCDLHRSPSRSAGFQPAGGADARCADLRKPATACEACQLEAGATRPALGVTVPKRTLPPLVILKRAERREARRESKDLLRAPSPRSPPHPIPIPIPFPIPMVAVAPSDRDRVGDRDRVSGGDSGSGRAEVDRGCAGRHGVARIARRRVGHGGGAGRRATPPAPAARNRSVSCHGLGRGRVPRAGPPAGPPRSRCGPRRR